LNSTAAISVEAATPTWPGNGRTWVASVTTPMYTPTTSPVTSAYESVQLMILSISYSRNFKMPIPSAIGRAVRPGAATAAITLRRAKKRLPLSVYGALVAG
jgi:hypothetical protein